MRSDGTNVVGGGIGREVGKEDREKRTVHPATLDSAGEFIVVRIDTTKAIAEVVEGFRGQRIELTLIQS